MAGDLLMSISQDERERAVFRSRRMYQTDQQSNIATAEDRGKKIGIGIGEKNRSIEIARDLMKINLPLDQIAMATGLTSEEVNRLRNEN